MRVSRSEPLSIRQLEVFVALVDQGSFTRAARHLRLSQSTVSGHIADLERRLAARLVERERSGVVPTSAGKALLRPAREVLRAELGARMAVQELTGLLRGSLRVGGSTIPASYLLPALFGRFRELHPGISLQLVTGDSREIVERVLHADVEVGVVGLEPSLRELESAQIGEDRLILILPPDHPLARKKSVAVGDLANEPVVLRERGSGTRAATEEALAKLSGGEPEVICEVGSTEALKAAVRSGLGVAFVSSLAVQDELGTGGLATVRVRGFAVRRAFFLVTRRESLLSPAARAFREVATAS
jgi:DNA-binding transcriptional LysR family regulator